MPINRSLNYVCAEEICADHEAIGRLDHIDNKDDADFDRLEEAYDKLLWGITSVGPPAASKILHTINPELIVMWDTKIIKHYMKITFFFRLGTGVRP